jgi:hypothetical protein
MNVYKFRILPTNDWIDIVVPAKDEAAARKILVEALGHGNLDEPEQTDGVIELTHLYHERGDPFTAHNPYFCGVKLGMHEAYREHDCCTYFHLDDPSQIANAARLLEVTEMTPPPAMRTILRDPPSS